MAKTATYHIEDIYRGDDYSLRFNFWTNPAHTTAFNLASPINYTFTAQIRETPDSALFTAFTMDLSSKASGIIVLALSAAQTTTLPERGFWDLQAVDSGANKRSTILRGRVIIPKDVTR